MESTASVSADQSTDRFAQNPADLYAASSAKNLMRRMTSKILRASLIYLVALVFSVFIVWLWGHSRIWTGAEYDYSFWHWAQDRAPLLVVMAFALGEFLIFSVYFYRMGRFLQEITAAMERVQAGDDSWITLSDELAETAAYMNRIKTQIRQSRLQAREAEQRKNDLVVYLAHDLKTPLTSVLGYLTILEESPDIPAKQRGAFLSIARRKAERLEELINEFFEITRFNLTGIELEMRRIDLTLLLEQTVYEFRPMLEEKHLTCELAAQKGILLYCDLDKLQHVIDNLLRNACYYAYENTGILLGLEASPETIRFTCTNHGPTIPAEKLERIFEQFYRLDSARTSSTGGAGLGLAIARHIVQLHGGSIRAESADEVTTFTVILPANLKES